MLLEQKSGTFFLSPWARWRRVASPGMNPKCDLEDSDNILTCSREECEEMIDAYASSLSLIAIDTKTKLERVANEGEPPCMLLLISIEGPEGIRALGLAFARTAP